MRPLPDCTIISEIKPRRVYVFAALL
uniref:Uncharacterized protein n=1 Tax=Rhizophora mucronata TaxID=61149 RepID=A0A2P2NB02_RHIMU